MPLASSACTGFQGLSSGSDGTRTRDSGVTDRQDALRGTSPGAQPKSRREPSSSAAVQVVQAPVRAVPVLQVLVRAVLVLQVPDLQALAQPVPGLAQVCLAQLCLVLLVLSA
jgi:hypothetical protein